MEVFIGQNPGLVAAAGGLLLTVGLLMLTVTAWLYRQVKNYETSYIATSIGTLTTALEQINNNLTSTIQELHKQTAALDRRLVRIEAEHQMQIRKAGLALFDKDRTEYPPDDYPYVSK